MTLWYDASPNLDIFFFFVYVFNRKIMHAGNVKQRSVLLLNNF